jgi:hypothetical protein
VASTARDESAFGPLEVGKDYLRYRRVTEAPFLSSAHGDTWVHVYVSEAGAGAYTTGAEIPVGTVVVKEAWLDAAGKPSRQRGPLFVMEKRAPGYDAEHGDWYYALHWANPPAAKRRQLGGPVYWRGKSPRLDYCYDCHDAYERNLGGLVPSSQVPR